LDFRVTIYFYINSIINYFDKVNGYLV